MKIKNSVMVVDRETILGMALVVTIANAFIKQYNSLCSNDF